jgi:hypothetical protein
MVLLVFAPAYIWAARCPDRHPHIILVAFLGKALGPFGFAWAILTDQLPLSFGWTILATDLPARCGQGEGCVEGAVGG